MRAVFMAEIYDAATDTGRSVTWEEYEDGRVSATEFYIAEPGCAVQIDSRGIFETALSKGYKPSVPDILLARYAQAAMFGGPGFENVSALLRFCEIPLDAKRLPMRTGGPASVSP